MAESEVSGSQTGRMRPWNTTVRIRLDERTMDRILEDLTEYAGYRRGMSSPLNLARWDLKAALEDHALPDTKPAK